MENKLLLTNEEMKIIREGIYPYSEAIPLNDAEELITKVQEETTQAQLSKVLKAG